MLHNPNKASSEAIEHEFLRGGMTSEDDILDFAGASFRSVWALELLLTLRRARERRWTPSEMIKELRSSQVVVVEALNNLIVAGLVIEEDGGGYRYAGAGALDDMVGEIERLYTLKPTAVMRKIVTSSNSKLQILSDAFRIKE
jgi:predicted transcriptional regulator